MHIFGKKQPQITAGFTGGTFHLGIVNGKKHKKEVYTELTLEQAADLARNINQGLLGMSRYMKK